MSFESNFFLILGQNLKQHSTLIHYILAYTILACSFTFHSTPLKQYLFMI